MRNIPLAAPEGFIDSLKPEKKWKNQWFIFSGEKLLISEETKSLPEINPFDCEPDLFLGTYQNKNLYVGHSETSEPPTGFEWHPLKLLHGVVDDAHFSLAGRAYKFFQWVHAHKFCGKCSEKMELQEDERCLKCPSCGYISYPHIFPVVMVLVKREDKILLARGSHFPDSMYSVLAGYVSPGETLEQCIEREVFEEVGIKVQNIHYFGSQPWPFSKSLLLGFVCDWKEGEILIEPHEIEEANWYDLKNLPKIPTDLSLARYLIDFALSNNS